MKLTSKLQPRVFLIIIATFFVSVTAQMNLALHGTAAQESTYIDGDGISYNASLATEGPANNNWKEGCSSTAAGQPTHWWGLLLPKLAYITNFKIYLRNDEAQRMNGFRLYFANGSVYLKTEKCFYDWNHTAYRNLNQSIDCDLSPTMNVYFFNRNTLLELCYIEIYGCFIGTWGNNCTALCPSNCINNHCYPKNGYCVWGCDPNNCVNNKCDIQTGVCTDGCVAGRAGQFCSKYNLAYNGTATQHPLNPNTPASLSIDGNRKNGICSRTTGSSSYLQVDTVSISVVTTVYLTYGDPPLTTGDNMIYCSNTSNSWVDGFVLYKGERPTKNINVLAVCRYITYVPPAASGVDVCEIEIGGCPLGRYGVNCEHFCHCKGLYDSATGQCTLGCFDGWTGERCDKACNNGYFGSECNRTCSKNCIKPSCDHVSGECNEGCIKGWEEYNCTKECDVGYFGWNCSQTCSGCISNKCDKADGSCSNFSGCKPGYVKSPFCNQECEDWYFGINCASRCNCLNNPCNKCNGDCSAERCAKGWQDISCNKECGSGYFGLNCAYVCDTCFNQSCDIFEGNCKVGCNDGYRGRKCETPVSAESLSLVKSSFFMGGFASMLGILLIILTVVIARRRILKKQESKKAINNSHTISNEQHYDDIMKMESVSTYQDLTKQTITVSNDYDQISNAYVNQ